MMGSLIDVLSLGGTIAMTPGDGAGVVPNLTPDALVAAVPGLSDLAEIRTQSFRQKPGAHLTFDDLEALAVAIRERADGGVDGVVVTQGTDTIEETAFALDRLLDLPAPVIVTGAMRNPTLAGADGPANLLAAVRVATSPEARGLGVLVVMNDGVHAARFVRKSGTSLPSVFVSALCGPIGWIVEERVRIVTRPAAVTPLGSAVSRPDARVGLLTVSLGDDGALIAQAMQAGYDGLVIEATGGGHVPQPVADAIGRAARQVPVILASRTGDGEVLAETYGFDGSEIDLLRRGVIRAGWLDGLKARVLLSLLLRRGAAKDEIVRAFGAWGGGVPAGQGAP